MARMFRTQLPITPRVKERSVKPDEPKQQANKNYGSHIESLRRQIATGTYRVNSSALATALIEHMQRKQYRRAA
jgi:anti-sigma28 factor (negative regulator of flagellin synthesis)